MLTQMVDLNYYGPYDAAPFPGAFAHFSRNAVPATDIWPPAPVTRFCAACGVEAAVHADSDDAWGDFLCAACRRCQEAYEMYRFTIVAPAVMNNGAASGYPELLRTQLLAAGFDGWTEYETMGSWRGKREPGVTFELFVTVGRERGELTVAHKLARIGRLVMPDQEAVQVTVDVLPTTLIEG